MTISFFDSQKLTDEICTASAIHHRKIFKSLPASQYVEIRGVL